MFKSYICIVVFLISFVIVSDLGAQAPQQPPNSSDPTLKLPEQIEPEQEMRNLVKDISKYARNLKRSFGIITQGGLNILEKEDPIDVTEKSPAITYMNAIDGLNILGLNFRPPLKGKKKIATDSKIKKELMRLVKIGRERGIKIFVTDFGSNIKTIQDSYTFNIKNGFIPFTSRSARYTYSFNSIPEIPSRPINENPKNITGLKAVKNYIYITDSSKYDRQQDFVIAVSNTNYDLLVVDVFHKGRSPFTKAAIQGMKFKKLGSRRLVYAYMNIGVAETHRYYWRDNWKEGQPPFIAEPVPANPDKHYVEFWQAGWRKIITGNTNSYIYGIVQQGFDGVIIDGLDSYKFFESGGG